MAKRKPTKPQRRIDQKGHPADQDGTWTHDEVEKAALFVSQSFPITLKAFSNPDTDPALRNQAARSILKARDAFLVHKPGPKGRVPQIMLPFFEEVVEDVAEQAMDLYLSKKEEMEHRGVNPESRKRIAKNLTIDFLVETLGTEWKADFDRLPFGKKGYREARLKNDLLLILTGHKTLEGLKTAMRRAR